MTNIDVLKRKLSQIQKYLRILTPLRKLSRKKIQNDEIVYGAIERYLYLLCQATIDFAEALIVYLNLRKPGTYGEIFEILSEGEGIISRTVALKMKKMVGFRNILAHNYSMINFDEVYHILIVDINDINLFLQEIKKKVKI